MRTEEEIYDLLGTDSDGTPIDLDVHEPSLAKVDDEMWSERTKAKLSPVQRQLTEAEHQISRGLRVDTAKANTPDAARLFRLRFPI